MKAVQVVWEDASVEEGGAWVCVEGAQPVPAKVFHQVGWLQHEDEDCIILTSAVEPFGKGLMAARERIPRGMVRSITELQPIPAKGKRK